MPKGFEPTRSTRSGRAGFEDKAQQSPAAPLADNTAAKALPPRSTHAHSQPVAVGTGSRSNGVSKHLGSIGTPAHSLPPSGTEAGEQWGDPGYELGAATDAPPYDLPSTSFGSARLHDAAPSAAARLPKHLQPAASAQPDAQAVAGGEREPDSWRPGPDSWRPGDVVAVQSRSAAAHKPRSNLSGITANVTAAVRSRSTQEDAPGWHPHHGDSTGEVTACGDSTFEPEGPGGGQRQKRRGGPTAGSGRRPAAPQQHATPHAAPSFAPNSEIALIVTCFVPAIWICLLQIRPRASD